MTLAPATIAAAQRDDRAARALVCARTVAVARAVARRFHCTHEETPDLAHDVVCAVLGALPGFDITRGASLEVWVGVIAARLARTQQRDRVRARANLLDLRAWCAVGHDRRPPTPEELLTRKQDRRAFCRALDALPRTYRAAVVARYLDESSVDGFAASTGCTPQAVSARLHKARPRLRAALGRHESTKGPQRT